MKNIAVAGTGYVGLTTGTCFADLGNRVTCIDINQEKIAMLHEGKVPIFEPGLSEMITRNVKAGRLHFTTDYAEALADAEFVFICVGTPSGVDGEADLRYVRMAAESIAQTVNHPIIIVNKSTVPVGTGDWVADIVLHSQPAPVPFDVVSCPEFMREGSAIYDFMNPDRVVLGSKNKDAAEKVTQLHLPLRTRIVVTDLLEDAKDEDPERWQKTKKFYNILADKVETVAPFLVEGALAASKPGTAIRWLTLPKALGRFLGNIVIKRKVLDD